MGGIKRRFTSTPISYIYAVDFDDGLLGILEAVVKERLVNPAYSVMSSAQPMGRGFLRYYVAQARECPRRSCSLRPCNHRPLRSGALLNRAKPPSWGLRVAGHCHRVRPAR